MINIPKTSFYFVRHGETDWNQRHLIMGSKDIPLNDKGIIQAEHAAYILDSVEISKVFSSSLKRASKTAEIIAAICEVEVEKMQGICERSRGSLEGKGREDLLNLSHLSDVDIDNDEERYEDFEKRILQSLRKILSSRDQCPVVVAHAGVFAVLAKILAGKQDIPCRNGEVFCFVHSVLQPGRWEIEPLEVIRGLEF